MIKLDNGIISTGGGVVDRAENRKMLQKEKVIFLDSSVDYLYKNIKKDSNLRPMLDNDKLYESISKFYFKRRPFYLNISSLTIDVEKNSKEQILALVESKIISS